MTKLIRITTVPVSLHKLIKGQPNFMHKHGFGVQLLSAEGKEVDVIKQETGIDVVTFPYTRTISPITDLKALWLTYKYFRKEKPDIVHTHTPKAGVVGMLAAKLARVPIRMHTVAGLPLMEEQGIKRKILNSVERLTSFSANYVYPNSNFLKKFMAEKKLSSTSKLKIIGNGSSNGINTSEFNVNNISDDSIIGLRQKLGFRDNDFVFVFVGRIVKDKGMNELLVAFDKLSHENKNVKLLLVGSEERELDPLNQNSQDILATNKAIINVGWQEDIRIYLAVSNVFVFPSYREGFPNVVMQAGTFNLPSIVTNINGSNEIIEDGINGLIIPVKDEVALFDKMQLLLNDKELLNNLSKPARKMIVDRFEQNFVWNELLKEYVNLLDVNNIQHSVIINTDVEKEESILQN